MFLCKISFYVLSDYYQTYVLLINTIIPFQIKPWIKWKHSSKSPCHHWIALSADGTFILNKKLWTYFSDKVIQTRKVWKQECCKFQSFVIIAILPLEENWRMGNVSFVKETWILTFSQWFSRWSWKLQMCCSFLIYMFGSQKKWHSSVTNRNGYFMSSFLKVKIIHQNVCVNCYSLCRKKKNFHFKQETLNFHSWTNSN